MLNYFCENDKLYFSTHSNLNAFCMSEAGGRNR